MRVCRRPPSFLRCCCCCSDITPWLSFSLRGGVEFWLEAFPFLPLNFHLKLVRYAPTLWSSAGSGSSSSSHFVSAGKGITGKAGKESCCWGRGRLSMAVFPRGGRAGEKVRRWGKNGQLASVANNAAAAVVDSIPLQTFLPPSRIAAVVVSCVSNYASFLLSSSTPPR